ncbi:MAG: glycosyltransferase family 25 protein [Pseudomonadota bacterium]
MLINLDRSADRLASFVPQINKLQLDYSRVRAVDGDQLDLDEIPLYSRSKTWARIGRQLANAEVGCFLSHLQCLNKFLLDDADACLILEDDLEFDVCARDLVDETCRWVSNNKSPAVDLVHLSRPVKKLYRVNPTGRPKLDDAGLSYSPYLPMTTGAILWTRSGATAFLRDAQLIDAPFDEYLQAWSAQRGLSYGFLKPPARQSDATSLIQTDRNRTKQHRGLVGPALHFLNRLPVYGRAYAKARLRFSNGSGAT